MIVAPIFKKSDKSKPENYGRICLLNTCYKYVKIIAKRVNAILEAKLLQRQNSFREGRGCTDASFTMKPLMEKRIEYNLETHMCFVDFKKVYNSLDIKIPVEVLRKSEIPPKLICVINDLYENTGMRIRIYDKISSRKKIDTGVRQGCPLSCILFNLYMNSIIRQWIDADTSTRGTTSKQQRPRDNAIHGRRDNHRGRGRQTLTEYIQTQEYCPKAQMKISSLKTKTPMVFKGKEAVQNKIVISQQIIERVNSVLIIWES